MIEISTAKVDKSARTVIQREKDMRDLVAQVFNSPDGDRVYQWLMNKFYHNQHADTDECKLSRHAGRRDVMVLLYGIVETNK